MDEDRYHDRYYEDEEGFNYYNGRADAWGAPTPSPILYYGPFRLVSVLMIVVFTLVLAAALCCLLLSFSDFAEEYPTFTKRMLMIVIIFNLVAHAAIMLVDRLSFLASVLSIGTNLLCMQLLSRFPFLPRLTHPLVLSTALCMALENVWWYFAIVNSGLLLQSFPANILLFFMFLWIVPVSVFSVSVEAEGPLPGSVHGASNRGGPSSPGPNRRKPIINRLLDFVRG